MTCILAVEDSPTQAEALRADLESAGFRVRLARNGPEALDALGDGGVDLLISDVVMPGMDGYELCRRVKDDERTRELPVVLLTTLTDPLDVVSGLEAGADNFIRKPYQLEQLVSRLETTLEHRGLQGESAQEELHLSFLDRDFRVTAERQQVLDLLISTFEELVVTSREVRAREEELGRAHAALEHQLHTAELERSRLQAVVDAVPVPLFVVGADGRISHASGATTADFAPERVRGRKPEELVQLVNADGAALPVETLPHHRAIREGRTVTAGAAFDVFVVAEDGSWSPILLQASPILDEQGSALGCVTTAQVLGSLTQHDPTTGLPNRVAFLDYLADALTSGRGEPAVLLLELDRIDVARASLGGGAGEAVVAEASRRLRQVVGEANGGAADECVLASLGGGQFGVVLTGLTDQVGLVRLAEAARLSVQEGPYPAGQARVTVSVGVSVGNEADEVPKLLAGASAALQRARHSGGNRIEVFGSGASQEAMDQLRLEADLRLAVERGDITLQYQPEVDLATGQVLGFEALARWQHPRLGRVRPDVFIALAEQTSLIIPLGRHVLTQACRQGQAWAETHDQPLTISVNISAVQLRPEFVGDVVEVLAETGLDPARLMIELTETAAMGDPETTVAVLEELRTHGVRFSLDDFGTGHSSLAQLTRIPFDQLKLDRSFVAAVDRGGPNALVAQSIVALGQSLGVPVIAEGVEEPSQADRLRDLGCDQAQGYLFSRPLTPEDAGAYLGSGSGDQ